MTRDEFLIRFRHELEGWLLDAAMTQRSGSDLSMFLRMMRQKIESKLGVMFDAMTTDQAMNGARVKEVRK